MGRLQRKKASGKSKKKKGVEAKPLPQAKRETAENRNDTTHGAVHEIFKGQVSLQKKSVPASKTTQGKVERNFLEKGMQFLREVKVELKKVTWPSRKQTIGSTVVVIILVMIISFFLGIVDVGLSSLVRVVLQ